jgi:hypothetical protein
MQSLRCRSALFSIVFSSLFILLSACGGSDGSTDQAPEPSSTRSLHMGFTPWPYGDSLSQVNNTYTMIQDHGDMVGHHLMEGIPWQESLDEASLPVAVENDIAFRISRTRSDKVVYLSIASLNSERNNLAPYWMHSGGNEPLPSPWDSYDFDNPEVANAYSRFALRMIDRFQPAYFNYAPEISELMLNDPDGFDRFKLSESEKLSVKFIIWFSLIDYDSLWNGALGQDDIAKIRKDTGLYDEQLNPRPSLATWDNHYRKTYR